jgi:hypothetical protein
MTTNFLSKDGLLNVEAIVALAREIDKVATKEQLKPAEIHFAGKVIPKYDAAKAKAGGEAFTKKRAQLIKVRSRMPASGSRVKMVAMLRNYKELEEFEDFTADFNAALKAIAVHNKLAEKLIATSKKEGAKKREIGAKEFDKNADAFIKLMAEAGVKSSNIAIGMSMMGKTIIVKLPNGGYVSVGKADAERFAKAKEGASAAPAKAAATSTRGSTRGAAKAEPKSVPRRSREVSKLAPISDAIKKVGASRRAAKGVAEKTSTRGARAAKAGTTAARETRSERASRREATDKVVAKASRSAGSASLNATKAKVAAATKPASTRSSRAPAAATKPVKKVAAKPVAAAKKVAASSTRASRRG